MALEELDIVIDIVDSFSEEIDELLADLETVDLESGKVDDIWIDVDVLGDEEIATLQSELASLTDEQLIVDADVRGEGQLLNFAALKEAVAADEISEIDFQETGLDQIIAKTAIANSQVMSLRAMAGDIDFGGLGDGRVGGPARGDGPDDGLLSFSMADLHNVLAKVIPLLLVFVGALPAAIGGLLGLATAAVSAAAALGAVTGLAGYGFALQAGDGDVMSGMQEILERVQESFTDAFGPIARDLAPLFEDGLEGLENFFDTLASHGNILRSLTDDARAFGSFMSEYIVGIATTMGRLADTAAPLFALLANVVEELDLIEGFTRFLAETLPSLIAFGAALGDIITRLANMSVGFLQVATMAIKMIDVFLDLITLGGAFDNVISRGIASLLALVTVGSILKATFVTSLIPAVWSFVGAIQTLIGYEALASTATYMLNNAISFLRANLMKTAITAAIVTGGLYAIAIAAGVIANQFMSTSDAIKDATDSLEEFQNLQSDVDGMGGGGGSVVYQFAPTSERTVINEENVQDAYRTVKTKQFDDAEVTS